MPRPGKAVDDIERKHGMWWLAGTEPPGVPGTLERHPDGKQVLRLTGQLMQNVPDHQSFRIIGTVAIGTPVSLDDCICMYSDVLATVPRQDWLVQQSVHGVELQSDDDWRFTGAIFAIPGVTRWAQWNQFSTWFEKVGDEEFGRMSISATRLRKLLWTVNGIRVELGTAIGVDDQGEDFCKILSRVDVSATSEQKRDETDFYRYAAFPVQVLFALSTGTFTSARSGTVRCGPIDPGGGERYFERRWHPLDLQKDPGEEMQMGFTLAGIEAVGIERLQAWVDGFLEVQGVADLYMAVIGSGVRFTELRFQMVTQALEVLHRHRIGGDLLPPDEWKDVHGRLREAIGLGDEIPQPQRVIRGKLKTLISLVLSLRIQQLLEQVGATGSEIAGEDPAAFAERVGRTRNRLTHSSGTSDDVIPVGEELFHATERLLGLLELCLMKGLGFDSGSQAWEQILKRRVRWLPRARRQAQ